MPQSLLTGQLKKSRHIGFGVFMDDSSTFLALSQLQRLLELLVFHQPVNVIILLEDRECKGIAFSRKTSKQSRECLITIYVA
jgi:hypothetical protein